MPVSVPLRLVTLLLAEVRLTGEEEVSERAEATTGAFCPIPAPFNATVPADAVTPATASTVSREIALLLV